MLEHLSVFNIVRMELLRLLLLLNGREHGLHRIQHGGVNESGGRARFRVHWRMSSRTSPNVIDGGLVIHFSIARVHLIGILLAAVGHRECRIPSSTRNETCMDVRIYILILMLLDLHLHLLLLSTFNKWEEKIQKQIKKTQTRRRKLLHFHTSS